MFWCTCIFCTRLFWFSLFIFCCNPPDSGLTPAFFFSSRCLWYWLIRSKWFSFSSLMLTALWLLAPCLWFPFDVLGRSTSGFLNLYRLLLAEDSIAMWCSSSSIIYWLSSSFIICSSRRISLEIEESFSSRTLFIAVWSPILLRMSSLSIFFSLISLSRSLSNFARSSSCWSLMI